MCPVASFSNIHWPSVLVAAASAFAIGGLWYSPVLFGNVWAKELKLSKEKLGQANMPLIFGASFVLNLIGAIVLDLLIGKGAGLLSGLRTGLLVGIAFIATSFGINYLFARKSIKLFLIDAGYFAVFYAAMGMILGVW